MQLFGISSSMAFPVELVCGGELDGQGRRCYPYGNYPGYYKIRRPTQGGNDFIEAPHGTDEHVTTANATSSLQALKSSTSCCASASPLDFPSSLAVRSELAFGPNPTPLSLNGKCEASYKACSASYKACSLGQELECQSSSQPWPCGSLRPNEGGSETLCPAAASWPKFPRPISRSKDLSPVVQCASLSALDPRLQTLLQFDGALFKGRQVLDIGTNLGATAVALANPTGGRAAAVVGVDIDLGLVQKARKALKWLQETHTLNTQKNPRAAPPRKRQKLGKHSRPTGRRAFDGDHRRGKMIHAGNRRERRRKFAEPESAKQQTEETEESNRAADGQKSKVPARRQLENSAIPPVEKKANQKKASSDEAPCDDDDDDDDAFSLISGASLGVEAFRSGFVISGVPVSTSSLQKALATCTGLPFPFCVQFVGWNAVPRTSRRAPPLPPPLLPARSLSGPACSPRFDSSLPVPVCLDCSESNLFDVVVAFSVSKWVHVRHGDQGLLGFFRTIHSLLKPGGKFVLEPQPWPSYRRGKTRAKSLAATTPKPRRQPTGLTQEKTITKERAAQMERIANAGFLQNEAKERSNTNDTTHQSLTTRKAEIQKQTDTQHLAKESDRETATKATKHRAELNRHGNFDDRQEESVERAEADLSGLFLRPANFLDVLTKGNSAGRNSSSSLAPRYRVESLNANAKVAATDLCVADPSLLAGAAVVKERPSTLQEKGLVEEEALRQNCDECPTVPKSLFVLGCHFKLLATLRPQCYTEQQQKHFNRPIYVLQKCSSEPVEKTGPNM
eukprot:GHVT01023448.1.p1 GENE.GHVT01023448.1~~GHVT01023448.1.p1  ORF type:complete len:791 (-),score=145.15 GHVT01023448.1:1547-3919(-)